MGIEPISEITCDCCGYNTILRYEQTIQDASFSYIDGIKNSICKGDCILCSNCTPKFNILLEEHLQELKIFFTTNQEYNLHEKI